MKQDILGEPQMRERKTNDLCGKYKNC